MTTDNDQLTYAKAEGEEPFNWFEWLNQDFDMGDTNTLADWHKKTRMASNWTTCACGNQCAVFPRYMNGRPYDEELARLGCMFYNALDEYEPHEALEVLHLIEQRSAYLLTCPNYTAPDEH